MAISSQHNYPASTKFLVQKKDSPTGRRSDEKSGAAAAGWRRRRKSFLSTRERERGSGKEQLDQYYSGKKPSTTQWLWYLHFPVSWVSIARAPPSLEFAKKNRTLSCGSVCRMERGLYYLREQRPTAAAAPSSINPLNENSRNQRFSKEYYRWWCHPCSGRFVGANEPQDEEKKFWSMRGSQNNSRFKAPPLLAAPQASPAVSRREWFKTEFKKAANHLALVLTLCSARRHSIIFIILARPHFLLVSRSLLLFLPARSWCL